jgi:glycerol-3-phosphate cytidylyltransferase
MKKHKRVLTYGTFDLFHYGHLNILHNVSKLADEMVVGLSTDEFNKLKGKKSFHSYAERKNHLEHLVFVDIIIPENTWEQKIEDIKKYKCDLFVMGDDWQGKFDFLNEYCEVLYLPRTENISSTTFKKFLGI